MEGLGDWTKSKLPSTVELQQQPSTTVTPEKVEIDAELGKSDDVEKGIPTTIQLARTFSTLSQDASHSGGNDDDEDLPTIEEATTAEHNTEKAASDTVESKEANRCDDATQDKACFSLEMMVCLVFITATVVLVGILWRRNPEPLFDAVDDEQLGGF